MSIYIHACSNVKILTQMLVVNFNENLNYKFKYLFFIFISSHRCDEISVKLSKHIILVFLGLYSLASLSGKVIVDIYAINNCYFALVIAVDYCTCKHLLTKHGFIIIYISVIHLFVGK